MNNLVKRSLTGTVFVLVMLAGIIYGPLSIQLLFMVLAVLSLHEFYGIVELENVKPQKWAGLAAGVFIYYLIAFQPEYFSGRSGAAIYGILALIFIIELYRKNIYPFHSITYTVTGIIYTVLPFALLVNMAFLNGAYSPVLPLCFFILLWCSDSFAYLFGTWLGKHRLFERISPKKSWEGTAGGFLSTMGAAWIISENTGSYELKDWMIIGGIIVVTGTLGDLAESMLKRSVNIKDSGSILPGHGGLLDRFDAMLLAVPFVYIYLMFR